MIEIGYYAFANIERKNGHYVYAAGIRPRVLRVRITLPDNADLDIILPEVSAAWRVPEERYVGSAPAAWRRISEVLQSSRGKGGLWGQAAHEFVWVTHQATQIANYQHAAFSLTEEGESSRNSSFNEILHARNYAHSLKSGDDLEWRNSNYAERASAPSVKEEVDLRDSLRSRIPLWAMAGDRTALDVLDNISKNLTGAIKMMSGLTDYLKKGGYYVVES